MANILFVYPNKWGRGITPIWIASHYSVLKQKHNVELFDATFFLDWSENEIDFNTKNKQYKKSNYTDLIKFSDLSIYHQLEKKIRDFKPDIIFWSAISSHIHGEGEYVNIEYGYELLSKINTGTAKLITAGLQATASPKIIFQNFKKINYLIRGESELVLQQIADSIDKNISFENLKGLAFLKCNKEIVINDRQEIITDLNILPDYDYTIFHKQNFLRAYNGKVLKVIDYELSRGCIYTCSYCVETDLVRAQDTNFLTIDPKLLEGLRDLIKKSPINVKFYIETRPEGINEKSVELLKDLGVDGVGMGLELAGSQFREKNLNRFVNEDKIIRAFDLLKKAGIKRTSYNIIGLPNQTENEILETINFNKILNPDNVTVAFYTPYIGTEEQIKSTKLSYFDEYEKRIDGQLRSVTKDNKIPIEKLNYYKENFYNLVKK